MGVIAEKDFIALIKNLFNISSNDSIEEKMFEKSDTNFITDKEQECNSLEIGSIEEYYDEIKEQIPVDIKNMVQEEMDEEEISYNGLNKSTVDYIKDRGLNYKGALLRVEYIDKVLNTKNSLEGKNNVIVELRDSIIIEYKKRVIVQYRKKYPDEY